VDFEGAYGRGSYTGIIERDGETWFLASFAFVPKLDDERDARFIQNAHRLPLPTEVHDLSWMAGSWVGVSSGWGSLDLELHVIPAQHGLTGLARFRTGETWTAFRIGRYPTDFDLECEVTRDGKPVKLTPDLTSRTKTSLVFRNGADVVDFSAGELTLTINMKVGATEEVWTLRSAVQVPGSQ
jgi:hypothetical protein